MLYTLRLFSSKCSLFHNAKLFGSCIIHILYKECVKIRKNNSGAKGLISLHISGRIVLLPALTNSAGIWLIPGDLWLFSFSIANSTSFDLKNLNLLHQTKIYAASIRKVLDSF